MTYLRKSMMWAGAALFAAATTASAATISIDAGTGTAGSIPDGATNELLTPLGLSNPLSGTYGAEIVASGFGVGDARIRVEVMGYEAGFRNTFTMGGDSFTSSGGLVVTGSAIDVWEVSGVTNGTLAFSFSTNGNGGHTVSNGSNPDDSAGAASDVNFFAHDDGNYIWLFFDDDGANNDDNHDDLVVRLSVVPLPAGALLLITGLGALALRRRRKDA